MANVKINKAEQETSGKRLLRYIQYGGTVVSTLTTAVTLSGVAAIAISYYNNTLAPGIATVFGPANMGKIAVAFFSMSLLLSCVLFYYINRYKRTKYRLRQMTRAVEKYQSIEPHFRELNSAHAECDKELFDNLFYQRSSLDAEQQAQLATAAAKISTNIDMTMDSTAIIVSDFLEVTCSSTLWLFRSSMSHSNGSPAGVFMTPYRRDRRSKTDRRIENSESISLPHQTKILPVFENRDEDCIFEHTTVRGKKRYYLLCAVPSFDDENGPHFTRAALTVDADQDSLSNDTVKHYLKELSYRIGVMLYRQNRITSRLQSTVGGLD